MGVRSALIHHTDGTAAVVVVAGRERPPRGFRGAVDSPSTRHAHSKVIIRRCLDGFRFHDADNAPLLLSGRLMQRRHRRGCCVVLCCVVLCCVVLCCVVLCCVVLCCVVLCCVVLCCVVLCCVVLCCVVLCCVVLCCVVLCCVVLCCVVLCCVVFMLTFPMHV